LESVKNIMFLALLLVLIYYGMVIGILNIILVIIS